MFLSLEERKDNHLLMHTLIIIKEIKLKMGV